MKKHLLILGIAPALALAACGGGDNEYNNNDLTAMNDSGDMVTNLPAGEGMDANAMGDNAMAVAPMTGQQFANTVAASDAYEMAAGKLAQQKATTDDLKDFGREMIDDHSDSTKKLKDAAAKATPAITPDATMTAEQQANLSTLQSATGAAFDSAYRTQQLAAHEKALAALRAYAQSGDVPELRDFAKSAADTVSEHLEKLRGMENR